MRGCVQYHNDKIFRAYERWDEENPQFWPMFVEASIALANAGRRRIGAKLVFEHLRYSSLLQTKGDVFRVNNNYSAIYARRFMLEYPEHGELFETRATDLNSHILEATNA